MLERESELLGGDLRRAEGGGEERGVVGRGGGGDGGEFCNDAIEGLVHLDVVFNGNEDLRAERRGASVPEEVVFPSEIEERHRIASAGLVAHADADAARIGERGVALVAGGAGKRAIAGEGGLGEEDFAEGDALLDERVVAWQIGDGKGRAHLERVGRVVFWQIQELYLRGAADSGCSREYARDAKGTAQVGDEGCRHRVADARVRGGAVAGEGEGAGCVEQCAEIEV